MGGGNYMFFVSFVTMVVIDCLITASSCATHLLMVYVSGIEEAYALKNVGTFIVLVISALMLFPSVSLLSYHISLIRKGKTTREDFKIGEKKSPYMRDSACFRVYFGPDFMYSPAHSVKEDHVEEEIFDEREELL